MEDGIPKPENSELPATEPAAQVKAASMLVVLAKRESSVRSTVTFLERRGFAAKVVATLNEAVELFSKKEANMLLLSMNFSHPKVEMLPALLSQSFNIETIVYAEESDRKTSNKLSNSKSKHVLFGPVSGPVVMMKLRQIEREMSGESGESSESSDKRTLQNKDDQGDIKIGGRKGTNDDTVVLNGKTDAKAKSTFDNVLKALTDGEEGSEDVDEGVARSGETYIQRGARAKMKSAGGDESDADGALLSDQAIAMREALDRGLTQADANAHRPRLIMPSAFAKAARLRKAEIANEEEADSLDRVLTAAEKIALSVEDKVRRCLRESLSIVAGSPEPALNQLGQHAKAALISLRTRDLNCAFVISLNYATQTANELFQRIQISFFSLLRDYGVEFEDDQTYSIFLDNMRIVRDAFTASEFTVVTRTSAIEIGAAKVYVTNPVPETEIYNESMHSIRLQDLPPGSPVTFNLFLHLKRNGRFFRYLKIGSSISDRQVVRLTKRNAVGLVEQGEVEAYLRFFAAHSIQAPKKSAA